MPDFTLTSLDVASVIFYAVFIIIIGLALSRNQRTAGDYFLAGRSLHWWVIGLSLFATNMSSSTLIGLPGSAYQTGIAVFNYEWMAAVILVIFVVFFLPYYFRSRIYTVPEYLERRFDIRVRVYFSLLTLLLNIIVDTAGAIYAGTLVVGILFPNADLLLVAFALAIFAGLYTMTGGLKAVVYTDAIQAILLIIGSVIIAILAFIKIGSWQSVRDVTPPEMLSLIRPADDKVLPWPGLFTGVLLIGFYFWCTNQFMVQRVLAAKNLAHARHGALFAGLLKLPVLFIMVLPGSFARVLYPDLDNADMVFPVMMFDLLPAGLRGIILVALLAAIMSSIDSTLNSASTLVTMDFINRFKPGTSQQRLVLSGRLVTFTFMLLAAAWTPVILRFPNLWTYLQSILAYASPPVVACFIIGHFWKRANASGAMAALVFGHIAATLLFLSRQFVDWPTFHFLHVPSVLIIVSALAMILSSLLTKPPGQKIISLYTWPAGIKQITNDGRSNRWLLDYRWQSVALLMITGIVIILFW